MIEDKRDLLIVKLQGKLDTLQDHAIKSVENLNWNDLTKEQRQLINCLYANKFIDLVDGVVKKHILTMEELLND